MCTKKKGILANLAVENVFPLKLERFFAALDFQPYVFLHAHWVRAFVITAYMVAEKNLTHSTIYPQWLFIAKEEKWKVTGVENTHTLCNTL